MRIKARKDANQAGIVKALRAVGACAEIVNMADVTDLLVCFRGRTVVMEVKNPERRGRKRQLKPGQERFRVRWTAAGGSHARVETVDDALRAIGLSV